jgi:hypothetical protein
MKLATLFMIRCLTVISKASLLQWDLAVHFGMPITAKTSKQLC